MDEEWYRNKKIERLKFLIRSLDDEDIKEILEIIYSLIIQIYEGD